MTNTAPLAYYNEIDPFAAAWLRELIVNGHIAMGDVDERSIEDVRPDDLRQYTQCHFFAGIGVWSYALRNAGWPDERPVWTGSCPCQPFSAAGKGKGFADERHLWPALFHLIESVRPKCVFGEQVASKDGLTWLDLVQTDMEGTGYSFGAVDSCAAGFGAPHIRQRLYWVANTNDKRERSAGQYAMWTPNTSGASKTDGLANLMCVGRREGRNGNFKDDGGVTHPVFDACGLADTHRNRCTAVGGGSAQEASRIQSVDRAAELGAGELGGAGVLVQQRTGPTDGHWRSADWLFCRDDKWRPVEPSTFPLAHGASARVGRLRGYGNAIVAPQAQAFIEAYLEVVP